MGEIAVSINGRNYGIACDDGQEDRVQELGRYVDERLKSVAAGGATNEGQKLVLTAIVLADEIADLREYVERMDKQGGSGDVPRVEIREVEVPIPPAISEEQEVEFSKTVGKLAERIDLLAARLSKAA